LDAPAAGGPGPGLIAAIALVVAAGGAAGVIAIRKRRP
jgi:hypothetical protein